MNENMTTMTFGLKLSQCESKAEYEALMIEHQNLYVSWRAHLTPMLKQRRLKYAEIATGLHVSESTAKGFLRKIPAKREYVIMLAMMMKLTVDETNDLLMRWAKFQKLYSRNPHDAIWIYLLEKGGSNRPHDLFCQYDNTFQQIRREYQRQKGQLSENPLNTQLFFDALVQEARSSETDLDAVDPGFIAAMEKGMPSFEQGYQKLLDHIDSLFTSFVDDVKQMRDTEDLPPDASRRMRSKHSANNTFQNDDSWRQIYYRKIRDLKNRKIIPCRAFLIALGLRLGMNTDQLNYLLDLAGMGPLCPKDKLEGTVVFYLEELYCNFPSYFNQLKNVQVSEEYDLMDYSSDQEADLLFHVPNIAMDSDDNPEEPLNDYIKRAIMDTLEEDDYIQELVKLL